MNIKKSVSFVLFIGLGAAALSAQAAKPLDAAINEAAGQFAKRISSNTTVAVTSFGSSSPTLSDYIMSEMAKHILNAGAFGIVTREHLDEARKELKFNMTSEIDEKTAQNIGRFVGAQAVIFGSIAQMGKNYYMKVQAVQVETGRIMSIYTATVTQKSVEAIMGKPTQQPVSNPFKNFHPFTEFEMIGFNYLYDKSLGFTIGAYGVYMTMDFYLKELGSHSINWSYTYNNDETVDDYTYQNRTTYEKVDLLFGYNFNIIPERLYIPIGAGARFTTEYRLYKFNYYPNNTNWLKPSSGPVTQFEFETGVLVRMKIVYLSATYRNIGLTTHAFSLGVGVGKALSGSK